MLYCTLITWVDVEHVKVWHEAEMSHILLSASTMLDSLRNRVINANNDLHHLANVSVFIFIGYGGTTHFLPI
jgi:hypothetical protein